MPSQLSDSHDGLHIAPGIRIPRYVIMDGVSFEGLSTLLRVDINSPIDPDTGKILDTTRIRSHLPTIEKLVRQNAKVILLAHQGQKGEKDFISLRQHAKVLSEMLRTDVQFADKSRDGYSEDQIRSLGTGQVLMLENVRFLAEETANVSMKAHAESNFVQCLSRVSDVYINDAFAAAHRNQASLVGFPFVLPSFAGLLMSHELQEISRALNSSSRPNVFLIGGGKVRDSIKLVTALLRSGLADNLILYGLVGNVFLRASGRRLGTKFDGYLRERKLDAEVSAARELLERYGDKIILPKDVAVLRDGERRDVDFAEIMDSDEVLDIGMKTIETISNRLEGCKSAFVRGPPGVIEREGFELGTEAVLQLLAEKGIFTIIGGGHTRIIAEKLKLVDRLGYASTGGGALLTLLSGESLPALEALELGVERTMAWLVNRRGSRN